MQEKAVPYEKNIWEYTGIFLLWLNILTSSYMIKHDVSMFASMISIMLLQLTVGWC